MKIQTSEIPQADLLSDVVRVAEAIQCGFGTFQGIAHYIGKVDRQGRYYRLAAELIGFIHNEHNHARLTDMGKLYLKAALNDRILILRGAVLQSCLFQRIIPFLENHPEGITKSELQDFIVNVTERIGPSMVPRRISTIVSWLQFIGVITTRREHMLLNRETIHGIPLLHFRDTEPLLPRNLDLKDYQTVAHRVRIAAGAITVLRNQAAFDRANAIHQFLINLIADRLRQVGAVPKYNQFIDLATFFKSKAYIFEMKSINADNARDQIRAGLSQLYEYRYIQDRRDAILILVVSSNLSRENGWMKDYLENDRQVYLLWNNKNELCASPRTRKKLSFFW